MPGPAASPATRLLTAIAERRAPHTLFIASEDAEMAAALARKAAALHCLGAADAARLPGCRDCIVPPSYHKDDMRTLRENLHLSSFSGGSRAVLLIDAHTIAEEVQHLLLKTMEEPPAGVLFLLTGREAGLLPTILSRCAILRYPEPSVSEIAAELQSLGAPMEEALSFAAQGGTLERARRLMQQPALRALRIRSHEIIMELQSGRLPFDTIKQDASADTAHFMLSFMGDVLCLKTGRPIRQNHDANAGLARVCDALTPGSIKRIADSLARCMERLNTNAGAQPTFTRLYIEIAEEFNQ